MKQDLNSLLLLFIELFIHLRNESNLTFLNVSQLEKYRYDCCSYGRFIYLIDKVDEPEKTTGPSGVIPIAVLKVESIVKIQLPNI